MDNVLEFLRDWTREFIKSKNVMTKSILSMDNSGTELVVKHKDREQRVMIIPFMNSYYEVLKELAGNEAMYLTVVTFNSDKSFKALLESWKELVKFKNLNIYFANPFSMTDKKWIIYPHVHAKICDEDSLE